MNHKRQRGRPAHHDVVFDKIVHIKISEFLRDELKNVKSKEEERSGVGIGWTEFLQTLLNNYR
jgi:hypothetical protein